MGRNNGAQHTVQEGSDVGSIIGDNCNSLPLLLTLLSTALAIDL